MFVSTALIPYAVLVEFIFSSINLFSLSNSFGCINITSVINITKNKSTKYPGIVNNVIIIFLFLFFTKNITDSTTAITITTANILYPHNFIVDSINPAPVSFISSPIVKKLSVIMFCVLNIV